MQAKLIVSSSYDVGLEKLNFFAFINFVLFLTGPISEKIRIGKLV